MDIRYQYISLEVFNMKKKKKKKIVTGINHSK